MIDDICEIKEHIATLSENATTTLELNLVSWDGKQPKLDLRRWSSAGEYLKGLTLTQYEAENLRDALIKYLEKK